MRIVIGCQEICGWIELLASEFEKQGHQVISISNKSRYYQDISYTIDKATFEKDYFNLRLKNKFLTTLCYGLYTLLKKIGQVVLKKNLDNRIYVHAINYMYKNTDIYIHIWEGLETNDADLVKFRNNNTRIVSWFVGDDVRYYPVALKEFNVVNNYFLEYSKKKIDGPIRKLRMHEKYSDAIFSVPDQSSLALRPYFHLQVPINLLKYSFKKTGNTSPFILHIPSAPLLKGTPIFEKVIQDLKDEGLEFKFKSVTNIPNSEVRKLLTEADILLDELYMHGPGMIGVEAMASGCCVVVKYLEDSPPCFRPPVVSVNVNNLKEKLRELISNKQLREEFIDLGLKFVSEKNNVENVCKLILNSFQSVDYDYYPKYFREQFEPEPETLDFINVQTELVMNEDWYKSNIKPGTRMGLKF